MVFFFDLYGCHRNLHVLTHSFPTRRSSDLYRNGRSSACSGCDDDPFASDRQPGRDFPPYHPHRTAHGNPHHRSEEHTSELQSLMRISYAVFCLKKKIVPSHYQSHILTHVYYSTNTTHPNLLVHTLTI